MKKQILTLMVSVAVFATSPAFGMNEDERPQGSPRQIISAETSSIQAPLFLNDFPGFEDTRDIPRKIELIDFPTTSHVYAGDRDITEGEYEFAMKSVIPSQTVVKDQWKIEEYENNRLYGKGFLRVIDIHSELKPSCIKEIVVGELEDNNKVYTDIRMSDTHPQVSKVEKNLNTMSISFGKSQGVGVSFEVTENKVDSHKFLSVFYNRNLIPDFVIDHIVKHIGIEDFRVNTNRVIERITPSITGEEDSSLASGKEKID